MKKNTFIEVKKIINLRKEHSALRNGDFYTLQADNDIYSYVRSNMNERLLVVLNKGNEAQEIQLHLPSQFKIKRTKNLSTGHAENIENGKNEVKIAGMDWAAFVLE